MIDISNALPRGTILQGPKNKYRIQHVLGQGSFGITYLATTEMQVSGPMGSFTAKVQVAVKEFFMKDLNGREGTEVTSSSQGGLFTDYKKKFQREAVNLSKLHHPYIVKVLESFEANGTAYYVMEYLEGGSLDAYIEQKGGLPETEALRITRQIGDALEFMHQRNMLHLDVKPGNVMLRPTGEVVLIDFGLSKQFDKNGKPESSTTIGGGTPGYAPLEQAKYQRGDGLPVTMDVYALGGTLYKMLTGEQPPEASDVLNDGLPTFVLERHGITARTIASIVRAMSPLRRNRFQDIRAFMEALKGSGASQSEDPTVITGAEPSHRNRASRSSNSARPLLKPINWKKVAYIFSGVVGVALALILFVKILQPKPHPSDIDDSDIEVQSSVVKQVDAGAQDDVLEKTFTVNGVSFKMIHVEGGTFTMGATSEQGSDADSDESPTHRVTLSSYYIGETEVTQALWEAVMGTSVSDQLDKANKEESLIRVGNNYPMYYISWDDCKEFISRLNSLTGKSFRLPKESEWEYAAKGGNKSRGYEYSGSNEINDVAWYATNAYFCGSESANFSHPDYGTHNVKTKKPNELGIYDMSGNVWEWCEELYDSSGSFRVIRGGSWPYDARSCRVSGRNGYLPDYRFSYLGLRLAL